MRGGDYPSTLENPAGVNTAHWEPAICIEIMAPVLRSPHSGGPLIERARCEIGGIIYQAESTSGAICKLCRVLWRLAYLMAPGRLSGAASWPYLAGLFIAWPNALSPRGTSTARVGGSGGHTRNADLTAARASRG